MLIKSVAEGSEVGDRELLLFPRIHEGEVPKDAQNPESAVLLRATLASFPAQVGPHS